LQLIDLKTFENQFKILKRDSNKESILLICLLIRSLVYRMPRKRAFRCSKCDRTFILKSSFDEHNFRGIHDPMKPRGGIRKNAGRQLGNSGGPRDNAGGSRKKA
jgi:hypothetical protein